jgi:hypothetical protein
MLGRLSLSICLWLQTYKIGTGKDMLNSKAWFKSVTGTGKATRCALDPLNLRPQTCRLETRRNFFSQRVVDTWNNIPATLKQAATVKELKNGLKKSQSNNGGRHLDEWNGTADSCIDYNHGRTFSERCYLRHGESTYNYQVSKRLCLFQQCLTPKLGRGN